MSRATLFLREAAVLSLEYHLVCRTTHFGDVFWFATPWKQPLWQSVFLSNVFFDKLFGVATLFTCEKLGSIALADYLVGTVPVTLIGVAMTLFFTIQLVQ